MSLLRTVVTLCLLVAATGAFATENDAALITIEHGAFLQSDSASVPEQTALWVAQDLPDNWNLSRPGAGGWGWYRFQFVAPESAAKGYALYVPKLSMNAAFYVNGHFLADGGSFVEPVARHWNRPLLFSIPPHLLKPGQLNALHVRLFAYPNSRAGLDRLYLGPTAQLKPVFERRYFVQTILPQLCNIVVASLGLFALALWMRRRHESTYLYFFVFSSLWAIRSTHMFVRDIPVSAFYWDIWVQSSFGWCALLYIVLAMRYSSIKWQRAERALLIYALSGPLLMLLAGPEHLHVVANNWSFVIVPVAVVFEGYLIHQAWRERSAGSTFLAAVWGLIIGASVHDGLVHRSVLAYDSFYWASYVMILLSFVMGWILTNRFVSALVTSERLNVELEARVAQKHAALEKNFQQLQAMERDRAVTEERNRIMGEMHDGIGSQLISTIDAVEHGGITDRELAQDLRDVLDGLRLTIDSLEPTDNDLLSVLSNLRYRLEGRLKRQGIALQWSIQPLPAMDSLTPQAVLHILRILQEAFTNVIKHANANSVTLRTEAGARFVSIEVSDNGTGSMRHREGRGVLNMRRRAGELGAHLELVSAATGTRVRLAIPITTHIADAA